MWKCHACGGISELQWDGGVVPVFDHDSVDQYRNPTDDDEMTSEISFGDKKHH